MQSSRLLSMTSEARICRSIPFGVFGHFNLDTCSCKNKVHGDHDRVCGKSFLSASPERNTVVASHFLYPNSHIIRSTYTFTASRPSKTTNQHLQEIGNGADRCLLVCSNLVRPDAMLLDKEGSIVLKYSSRWSGKKNSIHKPLLWRLCRDHFAVQCCRKATPVSRTMRQRQSRRP